MATTETPVAVMRRVFRTKEARAVEYVRLEALLNLTFRSSYVRQSPFSFLYALSIGSVGASRYPCVWAVHFHHWRKG
jgi:hypothetical protein